jgi:hypothetical protein
MYHWPVGQGLVLKQHPKGGEVFMKKTQTKTDKKDKKAITELSETDLAGVSGGRRIIVYITPC